MAHIDIRTNVRLHIVFALFSLALALSLSLVRRDAIFNLIQLNLLQIDFDRVKLQSKPGTTAEKAQVKSQIVEPIGLAYSNGLKIKQTNEISNVNPVDQFEHGCAVQPFDFHFQRMFKHFSICRKRNAAFRVK